MGLRVALGQMDIVLGEPDANFATVQQLAADAGSQNADLLVLPELWSTGYDLTRANRHATTVDTGIFARTAQLAAEQQLHIFGSCLGTRDDGTGNSGVWFNRQGELVGRYDKIHRFGLMDEDRWLAAGASPTIISAEWGDTGLAICYDLRFPELFRAYALAGAKLIIIPAEWPHPRLAHWRTLLRARAIENQLFVVAVNRVGSSAGTDFFGHSTVIDPWGEIVVELGESGQLVVVDIDVDIVDEVRRKIPIFADRAPAAYQLRKPT